MTPVCRRVWEGTMRRGRENDDRDVFLRHAAVYALSRIGDLEAVVAHASDPSPAVRRAVLLVLRRAAA